MRDDDNSRMAAIGRAGSRLMAVAHAQSLHEQALHAQSFHGMRAAVADLQPVLLPASGEASRRGAMECLGRAIADLFECSRCFVATIPGNGRRLSEQVCIGHTAAGRVAESAIAHIADRLSSVEGDLLPIQAGDALARSAIGSEDARPAYSIIGRINAADRDDLVFVVGWRTRPWAQADVSGLSRAARVVWTAASHLTHARHEFSELRTLLGELVFPAFVVDEDLRLRDVNRCGKRLLLKGDILSANDGFLAGATRSATAGLKEAVCNALTSRLGQRWTSATIALTTGHQKFAFAWVGTAPIQHDVDQALVIVPRIDEAMGARRIATAFNLNCVEERIIVRILRGQCPKVTGAELGLTEATVRTYTKRIMLKLGIKRQSELFMLYVLTLSPFGSGRPEKILSNALPCSNLNGRACVPRGN